MNFTGRVRYEELDEGRFLGFFRAGRQLIVGEN